jgi:ribosome-binding protein aMBF1 (putative translation factor)
MAAARRAAVTAGLMCDRAHKPALVIADAQLVRRTLGENVRRRREDAGLSQEALADVSVVRKSTIARIEKAEQEPRISTLIAFSLALNVPLHAFMGGLPGVSRSCAVEGVKSR